MEARIREIDENINQLKKDLNQVKGSQTEVYSRIVGYYRSVKNWNHGKKEEYKNRIAFTELNREEPDLQEVDPVTDKKVVDSQGINTYSYFYRSSCPNCPAMKEVLDILPIEGEYLNVDMERGLEAASEQMVFSAPTVIFRSEEGEELYRTCYPTDVEQLFKLKSVSA